MATTLTCSAELLDLLEVWAVCNNRLEYMDKQESELFPAPDPTREEGYSNVRDNSSDAFVHTAQDRRVSGSMRKAGLLFLKLLARRMGLGSDAWFNAVVLLNAYLQRKSSTDQQHTSALYTAIISTLTKLDSVITGEKLIVRKANDLVEAFGLPFLTCNMLFKKERDLLMTLKWNMNPPSVYTWISAACIRFDLMTKCGIYKNITFAQEVVIRYAEKLLVQCPDVGTVPPRRLANGLVALGLVVATILEFEALCPAGVEISEFSLLFKDFFDLKAMPACIVPPNHRDMLFQVFMFATGFQAHELRRDAYMVLTRWGEQRYTTCRTNWTESQTLLLGTRITRSMSWAPPAGVCLKASNEEGGCGNYVRARQRRHSSYMSGSATPIRAAGRTVPV